MPQLFPKTIRELLQRFKWFSGEAIAPMPNKPPTPLLDPLTTCRMGYQLPIVPRQGWSIRDHLARTAKIPGFKWLHDPLEPRPQPKPWSWRRPSPPKVPAEPVSRVRVVPQEQGTRRSPVVEAVHATTPLAPLASPEVTPEELTLEQLDADSHATSASLPSPVATGQRTLSQRIRRGASGIGRSLNCFRPGHRREPQS